MMRLAFPAPEFTPPFWFHLVAVLFLSITGALAAMRRHYDIIGTFTLAFVAGLGGSLLRDGLFLQAGPPVILRNGEYLIAVLAGCLVSYLLSDRLERYRLVFNIFDAIGLAVYALVGTQMALKGQLSAPAAVLVGMVNAVGGGVLRDVLIREEPLLFKPGEFYALAVAIGCVLYVALTGLLQVPGSPAAWLASGTILVIRLLTIRYNWRTSPLRTPPSAPPPPVA